MQIDAKKSKRQELTVTNWQHSKDYGSCQNGFGVIWHPTGMGKTFTTLYHLVNRFLNARNFSTVIVLVHREELLKQWKKKIDLLVKEEHRGQITVQTVQYYIQNRIVPTCDLLIVDEVHKFYGDDYFTYVNGINIRRKFLCCLTATYLDPEGRHKKLEDIGCAVIDHITEQEALANGWISKYIEYNLGLDMTNEDIQRYTEISDFIAENLSKFPKHDSFGAAQKCISGNKVLLEDGTMKEYTGFDYALMWARRNGYRKLEDCDEITEEQKDINAMWNPYVIIGYAKNVMKGIHERKEFLNNVRIKLDTVIEIVQRFKNYKIMSFSESTTFADNLYTNLNKIEPNSCVVYHSQLTSRPLYDEKGNPIVYGKNSKKAGQEKLFGITALKRIFTGMFINNEVRVLSTARALDEGFDCEDIEISIISSRSKNFNQQTQRKGRTIRVIPEKPNSIMLIINVYIKGTRDYDSLVSAQKKATNRIYWVTSIDEINFAPKEHDSFDDI